VPAHLRVSVPDRPGALASLTRALAAAGANVISVHVVQREAGRAVDDLLLEWPFERPWDAVMRAVEGSPGARVHGLRHVATAAETPEIELVRQVLGQPGGWLDLLADALPSVLLADWAAAIDMRRPRVPVVAAPRSPLPLPAVPAALPRPRALLVDGSPVLAVPCADEHLRILVGRNGGPPFTRSERDRCAAVVDVVALIGHSRVAGVV
jgi:hypothetical protein